LHQAYVKSDVQIYKKHISILKYVNLNSKLLDKYSKKGGQSATQMLNLLIFDLNNGVLFS